MSPYNITPESMARESEPLRDRASHDEAQALYHAEQVGHAKGRTEGRTEAMVASIGSLMDSLGLSIEQFMSALKVPEVDRVRYRELLNR